jgi:signal transduction histidine kinase/ligand-binding sensor domain-containing protein/ActR/RegA family two-component response regulator
MWVWSTSRPYFKASFFAERTTYFYVVDLSNVITFKPPMRTSAVYSPVRRIILSVVVLAALAYPSIGHTEQGRPLIQSFGQRDTGTTDIFWATTQDERGVLYLGSGVVLTFDGERWDQFRVPGSRAVRALSIGEKGRLWVAAINEIGYFDRSDNGTLTAYTSLTPNLPDGSKDLGDVWHVFAQGENVVFITADKILVWNGRRFQITSMPGARRLAAMQVEGKIYISHTASGLWELDGNRLNTVISAAALRNAGVAWIARSERGWLLVTNQGLARFEDGQVYWFGEQASEYIAQNVLTTVSQLPDGRLCVGTINGGVGIISLSGTLSRILTPADGLQATSVTSIFVDREAAIWVTSSLGVCRVDLTCGASLFDSRNGFSGRPCNSIGEADSQIVVTTDDGVFRLRLGLNDRGRFEPTAALSKRYSDVLGEHADIYLAGSNGLDRFRSNKVSRMFSTTRGDILLFQRSTFEPETYLAVENFELLRLTAEREDMKAAAIAHLPDVATTLAEDSTGQIWVGTESRGIFRVRNTPGSVGVPFRTANQPIGAGRQLVGRVGESVLVCTSTGIEHYFGTERSPRRVLDSPNSQALALSNSDLNGTLWIAFESPFSSGNRVPILGRFTVAKNGEGTWEPLAVEGLHLIGGITRLFVDSRGILWVGGQDGLLRLEPDQLERSASPEVPVVKATVRSGAELDANENAVTFDFSAAEFGRRETRRFQTKLLGSDWSAPFENGHYTLAGLGDGDYEFAVRVINDCGLSSPPAVWRFTILPFWYKTKIALAGWAVSAATIVFWLVQWRYAYLRRRNVRLEALVQNKTEQLEKANAAKSEFLANMSHEIRNPISGIVGLSLAMQETALDERQGQLTNSIRSCADLLATLVDDVLDFSKIEAGKIDLRLAPFDLRATLEQCAMMVAEDTRARGTAVSVAVAPDVPLTVVGDVARVQQIVLNYLSNALKFGMNKPVSIDARWQENGHIRIQVRDLGPGFNPVDSSTLFTKFTRLEQTRALNIPGTGLGLAVCRLLAAKMGGTVGVDSSPGEGSCFWTELPLRAGSPIVQLVPIARTHSVPLSALIVEDIDYNAVAMQAVLRRLGMESDVATNGPAALEQLQSKFYDIAFMDWHLPGMIGTEVVSRFRAVEPLGRHTIIIATTAFSADFNRDACLRAGMDAFIAKPLTPEKIASTLRDFRGSLRAAASIEVRRLVQPPPLSGGLDLKFLQFLSEGTPEGMGGQINCYLAAFDCDLAAARRSIASGDATEIHRIAHRLISHCSVVQCEPLRQIALLIQTNAASPEPEALQRLFQEFEQKFANVRSTLESLRTSIALE